MEGLNSDAENESSKSTRPQSADDSLSRETDTSGPSDDSRRRSRPSRVSFSAPGLDIQELDDAALVRAVEDLQKQVKILSLENIVFGRFLKKYDNITSDMNKLVQDYQAQQDRNSLSSRRLTFQRASHSVSTPLLTMQPPVFDLQSRDSKKTARDEMRLNLAQKSDLVTREMEEIQANISDYAKQCHQVKCRFISELEEMAVREGELRDAADLFEAVFVTGTSDKFTQINPVEKFVRYMEEWLKGVRLTVDKIRLRTSSLKVQYHKICNELAQKKTLGENLQVVDFEQLHIENKHLKSKIEQRNLLLLELKKMNGKANLLLSKQKKKLLDKMASVAKLKEDIKGTDEKISKMDAECTKAEEELEKTQEEYEKVKRKLEHYEPPDVMDYVRKKAEVNVLKKNLKIWERRKQIKDMALMACLREMKQITGRGTFEPSWFMRPEPRTQSLNEPFEFLYQKAASKAKTRKKLGLTKSPKKSAKKVTKSKRQLDFVIDM